MTLEHFPLFTCDIVYPNPLVGRAAGDKAVLQDGVNRRGRGRVRERQAVRLGSIQQRGDKGNGLARSDDDSVRLCRELH